MAAVKVLGHGHGRLAAIKKMVRVSGQWWQGKWGTEAKLLLQLGQAGRISMHHLPPMHMQSCIPCILCYPCIMHPPSRRLRILLRKASNGTATPRGDCVAPTSAKHWRRLQRLRQMFEGCSHSTPAAHGVAQRITAFERWLHSMYITRMHAGSLGRMC